jgi:hypothetical protein
MRYRLLQQGPDDRSTYAECWGSTATSDGRLVAEAKRLVDLVEPASKMGHSNWSVHDTHLRVYVRPEEFWRRPSVAAFVKQSTPE